MIDSDREIKVGDLTYNPIADVVIIIDEDDDLDYVNNTYHFVEKV